MTCGACGEENPARARFCLACGSALAAPSAVREVRKTVTVVFCDLAGSTGIGERFDAEAVRALLAEYFAAMRRILEHHGGQVEKFIGDAVMAVFGIPAAHEDDALRAVRAAAQMRDALPALNERFAATYGVRLAARTGVNTGEVVAGAAGQTLVTGDAVNVAARLEQAAAAGDVLLGPVTYRLVRHAVAVEPVAPLEVKGKAEPVPAFRLLTVDDGVEVGARQPSAPLVGREAERAVLADMFAQAVSACRPELVTVVGAAGVGKTRLVADLVERVQDRATVLVGRCLPYGDGITFWPVAEMIRSAAGLGGDDPLGRLRDLLGSEEDADLVVSQLAGLVGLTATRGALEETFWGVRRLFETLARRRPVVAVFEDLHWAEPALLDLLGRLSRAARDAPLLVVGTARPDLYERHPEWGGRTLRLEPLARADVDRLIRHVLGTTHPPAGLTERIAAAAEGNPLFVEQLLGMLLDDGALFHDAGGWTAKADLAHLAIPPTVSALLTARLDRLPDEERRVVDSGSVIGTSFWAAAVTELVRSPTTGHLLRLLRRELIAPDRSAPPRGDEAFRFAHVLIRDAAYGALPKRVRADLHERFAAWVERVVVELVGDHRAILGYHLEQAVAYRAQLGPLTDANRRVAHNAALHLAAAGVTASERSDHAAAANLLARAAALLPEHDPERVRVLPQLGEALRWKGDFDAAGEVLREAERLVTDDPARAAVRLELAELALDQGGMTAAEAAELAAAALDVPGDAGVMAKAESLRVNACNLLGRIGDAQEAHLRAAEHARRAGDHGQERWNLHQYVVMGIWGPTPVQELERRVGEVLGGMGEHPLTANAVATTRAYIAAARGQAQQARAFQRTVESTAADLGEFWDPQAGASNLGGAMELLLGDPVAAERYFRRASAFLERLGETASRSSTVAGLAHAVHAQGRLDEAERCAALSRQLAADDDVDAQAGWRGAQAKVLSARAQHDMALALAREAVALCETSDMLDLRGDRLADLGVVLQAAGRLDDAHDAYEQALRLYERKENTTAARRTVTRLAGVRSARRAWGARGPGAPPGQGRGWP